MSEQTSEMDRLARPLDPEAWDQWDKYELDWHGCEATRETVRVVLEGLREPSEEMKLVGARSIRDSMKEANHTQRSNSCWQAMLNHILNERTE